MPRESTRTAPAPPPRHPMPFFSDDLVAIAKAARYSLKQLDEMSAERYSFVCCARRGDGKYTLLYATGVTQHSSVAGAAGARGMKMLFDGFVSSARAGRAPGHGSSIDEEFAGMDTSAGSVSGGGDLSSTASLQAALPRSMSSVLGSRPPAAAGSSPPHTTRSSCAPPVGTPHAASFSPSPCPPADGSPPAATDGSPSAAADGSPPAAAAGPFLPPPADGSPPTPDAGPSPGHAAGGSSRPPTLGTGSSSSASRHPCSGAGRIGTPN